MKAFCLLLSAILPMTLWACAGDPDTPNSNPEKGVGKSMTDNNAGGAGPENAVEMPKLLSENVPYLRNPKPGLYTSGQPSEEQFRSLATLGVKRFVNLRTMGERGTGWEKDVAKELGVQYTRLEIKGAAGITEANAKKLDALLAAGEGPLLLYCGSSNRVGALMGLRAHMNGSSLLDSMGWATECGVTRLNGPLRAVLVKREEAEEKK